MKDFLKIWMSASRKIMVILTCFVAASVSVMSFSQDEPPTPIPLPQIIKNIQVQGNQRVEANTVASYLLFAPGDPYSEERIDLSVKTLFATGLFADVAIDPRDGNVLILSLIHI